MNQQTIENTDQQALNSLQNSNWKAFEDIYDAYWSKLYLSAYSILRDKQASEDIVQDIFVQLWTKRNSVQIDSLAAYLHTSVRYQVFKVVKAGKVKLVLPDEITSSVILTDAEDALFSEDLDRILDQHIRRLPDKCRQVFILSRKQHLSITEISEKLGISSKTVENHLTNALGRLRTGLGDLLFWACIMLPTYW
ncbi:RNA polymerase sigma-70 factor [Dyadobacter psychrotolerans]|uniref:RNA polymerase sigma-70 factor n=1 Tax=Dyadobacter psychrotolerans TaxID=2541721 RepID=A0A4R5DS18_9BACT|nr:RNA polymerase sigma-70 factor [Dyadobacter psychrotolerans]TDE17222.1 RNA polymerase sigma-70 factor [Dyadobacter psychrotolerans]